jgi:hypothetical protein
MAIFRPSIKRFYIALVFLARLATANINMLADTTLYNTI